MIWCAKSEAKSAITVSPRNGGKNPKYFFRENYRFISKTRIQKSYASVPLKQKHAYVPVHKVFKFDKVEALLLPLVVPLEDELDLGLGQVGKSGLEVTFCDKSVVVLVQGGKGWGR